MLASIRLCLDSTMSTMHTVVPIICLFILPDYLSTKTLHKWLSAWLTLVILHKLCRLKQFSNEDVSIEHRIQIGRQERRKSNRYTSKTTSV
ncbi:hypothetical protein FOMG_19385 [Fusarium oxysporum f. sp. melonis 26406]|uniref:Uncharacterized protein n=1 Tax=Fusarium oxysporum f. sp. melonis 26406 TaxID=1089452 RepID=W9YXF5_FUSOX|nr:hypothetical protein FOMG_19385 [Fusarium oxysporum f. sp. melonis 26406]